MNMTRPRRPMWAAIAAVLLLGVPSALLIQAARAQSTDWTVTPPGAWQVTNPAVAGNKLTFTISSAPISFKGAATANTFDCDAPCTTKTFSYTVNAESNALLLELAGDGGSCFFSSAGHDDITSVSYNGVAMTLLAKRVSNINQRFHYVYGLLNPAVGAHNFVVSWTNSHAMRMMVADYGNVSAFGAVTTHDNASCSGTDAAMTTSLTTTAPNSWMALAALNYANGGAPTAGAGAVLRGTNANNYAQHFDSGAPIAAAGAYSITTNMPSATQRMSHIAVELKN